jgi:Fic family protein
MIIYTIHNISENIMTGTIKKWLWEHENYPNFSYKKERLSEKLKRSEYLRGLVSGVLSIANKDEFDELEITNLTNEIINTSQIEGEYLRRDSVRDSVAKAINQAYVSSEDMSTRHTDNLVALMLDSTRNNELLSVERLHGWHNALFANNGDYEGVKKINIAKFRDYDDMTVIENAFDRAGGVVKYLAPPHHLLDNDIDALIKYCNENNDDPYIKSALAHLWFVSIHPYDDGNGRISRAIADYVLSRDLKEEHKIYSMSTTIYTKRADYYDMLDMTTNLHKNRHFDFTNWIEWNIDILISTLEKAHEDVLFIVKKAKFWDRCKTIKLSKGQALFLDTYINKHSQGSNCEFSNIDYSEITKAIPMTAYRQINKMIEFGLISKVEGKGGRSTSYRILFDTEN